MATKKVKEKTENKEDNKVVELEFVPVDENGKPIEKKAEDKEA